LNDLFVELFLDIRKYITSKNIEFEMKRKDEVYNVLYSYETEDKEEIPLKMNDQVIVLDKDVESGWWYGHTSSSSSMNGFFPSNYVDYIPNQKVVSEDLLDLDAPHDMDDFVKKYNQSESELKSNLLMSSGMDTLEEVNKNRI
jgi:hypothetical protein